MIKFASFPCILAVALIATSCHPRAAEDLNLAPKSVAASMIEPGYILEIRQDNKIIRSEMSGAANIEQERAINEQTVFHIASLSKQITGGVLAKAILDGKVALDDPLEKWIPAASHFEPQPTLGHLAYMTSGIPEYMSRPRLNGEAWITFHYFGIDDAIEASLSAETLEFAPGDHWAYSNINYMLLAQAVSNAYEMPFSTLAERFIFAPLGMASTLINDDVTQLIPNRADAYVVRSDETVQALNGTGVTVRPGNNLILIRRNSPHYGGSGVMTSMQDWMLWQNEMVDRRVLGTEFWALMTARTAYPHGKDNDGLGLVHSQWKQTPSLWYSGGDIDANAYMVSIPSDGISAACFSNDPHNNCEDRVRQALIADGR